MKVLEDDTPGQFFDGLFTISYFLQDVNLSYDYIGDVMPPNRVNVINATGVVGKFRFESFNNHPYTGSLRGTDHGIFRISEVGSIAEDLIPSASAEFKYLRDGVDAGNHYTLNSFEGHPDTFNFLGVTYSTHVELPTNECLLAT